MPHILLQSMLVLTSLLLTSFTYAQPSLSGAKEGPIEINVGIYAPFSNKQAFIGRNMLSAAEMGRDKLKTSRVHYAFYTLDQMPATPHAEQVLQQFIATHHLQILLTEGSDNGHLAAKVAKQADIIHFSMATDPDIADGTNNFLAWSPVSEQTAVLIEEMKRNEVKQLGIIALNQASTQYLAQHVVKQLKKDPSIKVVLNEQFAPGTKDFSGLMNKMKKHHPDLYFIAASPKDIKLIQSQMRTAHIKKPITTVVERVTPTVMKVFDGQWYIDTHEMQSDFIDQFKTENVNYPVTEAGYTFDVFQMVHQSILMAMKSKHSISSEEIVKQLHLLAVGIGVMGPFSLDKHGVLYTKSEVKKVRNGEVMTV